MKIALVTFDSLRVDHLSPYNHNLKFTPTIEKLAKRSYAFNHFATSNFTLPSVASILTSSYPLMFGGFRKGISKRMNVAEVLSKNGFFTLALHSNALITTRPGYTRGFAKCVDLRHDVGNSRMKIYLRYILNDKVLAYARAEEVVERAVKEVRQLNKEKMFLWLHFMDNHHPYLPPAKFSEGMLTNPVKRARAIMLFKGYGREEPTKSESSNLKNRDAKSILSITTASSTGFIPFLDKASFIHLSQVF